MQLKKSELTNITGGFMGYRFMIGAFILICGIIKGYTNPEYCYSQN